MTRSLSVVLVCCLLISCASSRTTPAAAEAEVRQASDYFWATRQNRDAAALAAQFTESGILMIPGLKDSVGRGEILPLLERRFASLHTRELAVIRREIDVAGDMAWELAWFSEISQPVEGEPMRFQGRYLNVWVREDDGVWRVHRNLYAFSDARPVTLPAP